MIGEMVGKKDMRRPGKVRVKRDPMQPAIAAKIGTRPTLWVVRATGSTRHRSPPRPVTQALPSEANVRSIGSLTRSAPATTSTEKPVGT